MAAEGEFPKSDGDILFASEVNSFHNTVKQIYTGTAFNSTTATADPDEQSFELDAIVAVNGRNYAKIKITGTSYAKAVSDNTSGGSTQLKAQIKEVGGSYADIVVYKNILYRQTMRAGGNETVTSTYEILAPLTAGMKTNGFQVKVFSKSSKLTVSTTNAASFTNIQTVVELA